MTPLSPLNYAANIAQSNPNLPRLEKGGKGEFSDPVQKQIPLYPPLSKGDSPSQAEIDIMFTSVKRDPGRNSNTLTHREHQSSAQRSI